MTGRPPYRSNRFTPRQLRQELARLEPVEMLPMAMPVAIDMAMPVKRKPFVLTQPERSEHELQIQCAKMFQRILLPWPQVIWFAIDAAGSRDMTPGKHGVPIGLLEMQKFIRRGGRKGVLDLIFLAWRTAYWIELKKDADASLTDEQRQMVKDLITGGYEVSICWDLWQVFAKVKEWGLCRNSAVMT